MARTVGIGHQNYEEIRVRNNFYIDKTDFIREWWESEDKVTLIARPRRFGKTLNMSMLECFFSVRYVGRSDLFEDMKIWKEERFRRLQGTYPILFLSFAGVKETVFSEARASICHQIEVLYNQHDFLLEGDLLNKKEKDFYQKVRADMSDSVAGISLHSLTDYLCRYYGKKVIVLLDEYDTPMQEAYVNGYWKEMAAFIRGLFHSTFKTNPYLERAVMTGITRVSIASYEALESIFSDLNNLNVVTTTSNEYASCFGFTEQEVFTALEEYGYEKQMQEVKYWYDGFTFGMVRDIYNPWSIINFLDKGILKSYWANTSSNSLVGKLIREGNADIKITMEDLLAGKCFRVQIDEQLVFDQIDENESAIWSLLLASGYLKVEHHFFNGEEEEYDLALTNMEVRIMFKRLIRDWFARSASSYNGFVKALILGDVEAMNVYMNRVAFATFSYFDTGSGTQAEAEPERFYHGFVLGMMVELADRYTVTSNRESGFGRYDVMLEPKNLVNDAIIFEFKVRRPNKEKTLEETVQNALDQIDKKQYDRILQSKGYTAGRIRKYGFAFEGKKVLIGQR